MTDPAPRRRSSVLLAMAILGPLGAILGGMTRILVAWREFTQDMSGESSRLVTILNGAISLFVLIARVLVYLVPGLLAGLVLGAVVGALVDRLRPPRPGDGPRAA